MKTIKTMLVGVAILFFFACDELTDSLDTPKEVDITTTYTGVLNIGVPEVFENPDESSMVTEYGGLDLIGNPDVADVIGTPEQIKNVEVVRVKYEYKNFSGNVDTDLENGSFQFTENIYGSYPIPDVNIAESDLLGTVYSLSGDFSPMNESINRSKILVYLMQATATHNPATFQVVVSFTLRLKVEVDPF
ncbi:MAG: hypothetical protein WBM98_18740 [Maribacter sp.]|uniref:hypothetical protein n=1 Tax=Maribacter sp. TaxID=1897614 RepID=UPI003C761FB8